MKKFISSLYIIGTIASAFVPMYIVEKYTLRNADGSFVNQFSVPKETPSAREAANLAQSKFARSFGR